MFLETTFGLLRALWPFLRETIFGRDSVKEWLKKNGVTLVWMLFVLLMLAVVLKLVTLLNHESVEITTLSNDNQALQATITRDNEQINDLKRQLEKYTHPVKPIGIAPSSYPPEPKPAPVSVQEQALLDQLKQIKDSEEH
jgi:cell division protein FtsL